MSAACGRPDHDAELADRRSLPLAVAWLRALDAGQFGDDWCADEWTGGALATVGPRRCVELAGELSLGAAALESLLPVAGPSLRSWEGLELDPWLATREVRVRRALVEGLALTFSRTGDGTVPGWSSP